MSIIIIPGPGDKRIVPRLPFGDLGKVGLTIAPLVSLLIAEGRSIVEIARQAGHSPTMTLNTYGHVFDELDGGIKRPAEDVIRDARNTAIREARAPSVHPRKRLDASEEDKSLPFAEIF